MDFEAKKVSNLGGAAAELLESAECFSAIADRRLRENSIDYE